MFFRLDIRRYFLLPIFEQGRVGFLYMIRRSRIDTGRTRLNRIQDAGWVPLQRGHSQLAVTCGTD
ncbi:MAG: hypothetical protein OXU61_05325 [Gammaproteobacteria bacterium]|nr:hypothetical protein [Gammaproteobacteria bacterium]